MQTTAYPRMNSKKRKVTRIATKQLEAETIALEKKLSQLKVFMAKEASSKGSQAQRFVSSKKQHSRNYGHHLKELQTAKKQQSSSSVRRGRDFKIKDLAKAIQTNDSMISTDVESTRIAADNVYLSELKDKENKLIQNIQNSIRGRIASEKQEFQQFIDNRGLGSYYDRLWDVGIETLEALASLGVEQLNELKIPLGHQIKIEKGLKELGYIQPDQNTTKSTKLIDTVTKPNTNMVTCGMGTDDLEQPIKIENPKLSDSISQRAEVKPKGKLNFGVKKSNLPKIEDLKKNIPKWVKIRQEEDGTFSIEHKSSIKDLIVLQKAELEREESKIFEMEDAPTIVNNFVEHSVLHNEDEGSNGILKKNKIKKKTMKDKFRKTVTFNFDEQPPEKTADNPDSANNTTASNSHFSFTLFGSSTWSNPAPPGSVSGVISFAVSPYTQDRVVELENFHPKPAAPKEKKDCCYICLGLSGVLYSLEHPKIPNKKFCSDRCLNIAVETLLLTCPICYTLFDKASVGIPAHEKWTCSERCRDSLVQTKAEDLARLKSLVEKDSLLKQERERLEVSSAADLDLDFDF